MRVRVGTSGFSYKEWKGSFYPEKLPAAKMLGYYASAFDAVEINNTFYRMPKPSALEGWAKDVAASRGFAFALKAPVYLGLLSKGAALAEPVRGFFEVARVLGPRLGPIYLQLPRTMKKDVDGLRALLDLVPEGAKLALEPGDDSWLDDELYALLRERNVALTAVDDVERSIPIVPTADFGYVRLRRTRYTKAKLAEWASRTAAQPWRDAWVFFKHEDRATGPRLAAAFRAMLCGDA